MAVQETALPQDEAQDFEYLVRQAGKNPSDFKVRVMENTPSQPGPIARRVDIEHGGVKVSYDGSHGTGWLQDLERDLEAKKLG